MEWRGYIIEEKSYTPHMYYGHVRIYNCPQGHTWTAVTPVPPVIPFEPEFEINVALFLPGKKTSSRSGKHSWTPAVEHPIILVKPSVLPEKIYDIQACRRPLWVLARFRADRPFAHEAVLVAEQSKTFQPAEHEVYQCAKHYAFDISKDPYQVQGHLFLKKSAVTPRIHSPYQARVQRTLHVYNHTFSTLVLVRYYSWGALGTIYAVNYFTVTSPEHPELVLEPGVWEFYHPAPDMAD